jgi:mannose-6-phosphate isomerase-like protein (cupin superfamily)
MKTAGQTPRATAVSYGAALTFETLTEGGRAPTRMHALQDTLLRVIAGFVRVTIEADESLLGTGDELIVPAGAPHRIASAYGEARVVIGLR